MKEKYRKNQEENKNNKKSTKITKIMTKNKVLFEQSLMPACQDLPLDTALMLSKAGVRQCQIMSTSSPQQPV